MGRLREWYGVTFEMLRPHLQAGGSSTLVHPSDRVLVLGCGDSSLSADIHDSITANVTSVDFIASVVERMASEHATRRPDMTWIVGDVLALESLGFGPNDFDV